MTDLNTQYLPNSKSSPIFLDNGPVTNEVLKRINFKKLSRVSSITGEIYTVKDDSGLRFISYKLEDGTLILGPYIYDLDPIPSLGRRFSIRDDLPIKTTEKINSYIQLIEVTQNSLKTFNSEYVVRDIDIHNPVFEHTKKINQDLIKQTYDMEKQVRNYISKGDITGLKTLIDSLDVQMDFTDRLPNNPLRVEKNMCIIINTLGRISAEKGGLPSFLLHNISEQFALKIEKLTSVDQTSKLRIEIMTEYCSAVKNYGLKNHSSRIVKTCEYIIEHLHHKLELSELAEYVNCNPSYLSRLFKKEMGRTISAYIRDKRIMEARWMLSHTEDSITDIALNLGFEDVNYFSKVFHKEMSLSPTEYRKTNWKDDFDGIPI